jgi:hypothetical protein
VVSADFERRIIPRNIDKTVKELGLFYSIIDPSGWTAYDEEQFKDALEDWDYFGAASSRPGWICRSEEK